MARDGDARANSFMFDDRKGTQKDEIEPQRLSVSRKCGERKDKEKERWMRDSINLVPILTDLQAGWVKVEREKAAIWDDRPVVFEDGTWCPALDGTQYTGASLFEIPVPLCGCEGCADDPGGISTRNTAKLV